MMATHNDTGRQGEEKAVQWLRKNDFEVLETNWRDGHLEIDIIAFKEPYLHFVEVKTRSSMAYGYPEDEVGKQKLNHMINAGVAWLAQHPGWKRVQYDILAIQLHRNREDEYFLIEDVYV